MTLKTNIKSVEKEARRSTVCMDYRLRIHLIDFQPVREVILLSMLSGVYICGAITVVTNMKTVHHCASHLDLVEC